SLRKDGRGQGCGRAAVQSSDLRRCADQDRSAEVAHAGQASVRDRTEHGGALHDGRIAMRTSACSRACRAQANRSKRHRQINGEETRGGSNRTRTLLLATAALTAGIGVATYADVAAGQSAGVLMVYDTVDFHVATAKRTAGDDPNVRAALR